MQWTYKRDGTSLSAVSSFSIFGNAGKFLGQIPSNKKSIDNFKRKRRRGGNLSIKCGAFVGGLSERMRIIISD